LSNNPSDIGETQTGQSRANPLDVAWLAGIIDGEGCFSVAFGGKRRRGVSPKFYVGNNSMTLMLKAQRIVEEITGRAYLIRARDQRTNPIVFTMEVARQGSLIAVIEEILPHLTVKKTQAQEVLLFCRERVARRASLGLKRTTYSTYDRGLLDRLKVLRKAEVTRLVGGVEH